MSEDPSNIARREWYSALQSKVFDPHALEEIRTKTAVETAHDRKFSVSDEKHVEIEKSDDRKVYSESKWVIDLNSIRKTDKNSNRPSSDTILCFHGIGYNHSYFKKWVNAELLNKNIHIRFYGICLPGK